VPSSEWGGKVVIQTKHFFSCSYFSWTNNCGKDTLFCFHAVLFSAAKLAKIISFPKLAEFHFQGWLKFISKVGFSESRAVILWQPYKGIEHFHSEWEYLKGEVMGMYHRSRRSITSRKR
jgi:hypothetical protein